MNAEIYCLSSFNTEKAKGNMFIYCLVANKQYRFQIRTNSCAVIGRTRHVTSHNHIDWLAGLKIRIVSLNFAELEMDKIVQPKLYRRLRGVNINFNRIFQFFDHEI